MQVFLEHLQCSHYENSIAQSWIVDFGRIGIKEGLRAEGVEGGVGEFADNPGRLTPLPVSSLLSFKLEESQREVHLLNIS